MGKKRESKRASVSVRFGLVDNDGNLLCPERSSRGPSYRQRLKDAEAWLVASNDFDAFQMAINTLRAARNKHSRWRKCEEVHQRKLAMLIDEVQDELPPLSAEHKAVIVRLIAAGFTYAASQRMIDETHEELMEEIRVCNRGLLTKDDNESRKHARWQAIRELAPRFRDTLTGRLDMDSLVRRCIADGLGRKQTVYDATKDLRATYNVERRRAKAAKPRQRR